FPAVAGPNRFTRFPAIFPGRPISMSVSFQAPSLEIAVLLLGMLILLFECFIERIEKRTLAILAIVALAIIFGATFFLEPNPVLDHVTGFWSFYTADPLAIFFKRFALLTTILVLIMMIDYAPMLRSSALAT